MDAHRGMPLSLMAYLDAAGRTAELRELVAASQETGDYRPAVFYDRFTLWAILTAKTLTMRASSGELGHWRNWTKRNAGHAVDFAMDRTDPMPGVIHAISETILGIRAFRRFLRSNLRIRSYVQGLVTKAAS